MTKNKLDNKVADGKHFDCIKMKNSIQKQIYDETKSMSVLELLKYFNGVSLDKLSGEETQLEVHASPTPISS